MKTRIMTMALLVFCMAFAVSVQAKSGSKHSKSSSTTTVTGCLQSGTSANTYVLNNVGNENARAGKNNSGSQTPSEMARSSESNTSYTLIPQGSMNLQKWVGQRVRVTGKWATSNSSSSSSSSNMGSSSSQDNSSMNNSSSMSGNSELLVTSIHKASGTCQ